MHFDQFVFKTRCHSVSPAPSHPLVCLLPPFCLFMMSLPSYCIILLHHSVFSSTCLCPFTFYVSFSIFCFPYFLLHCYAFLSIFLFHSRPPRFLLLDDRLLCTNEPFPNLFLHLFFSLCSLASVLLVLGDTYNIPLDPRGKTKTTWRTVPGTDGSTSLIFCIKCIFLSEISDVPSS